MRVFGVNTYDKVLVSDLVNFEKFLALVTILIFHVYTRLVKRND